MRDRGELEPKTLELSQEAKAVWVAFHDDVEAELKPGRDMAEARDVASKPDKIYDQHLKEIEQGKEV